MDREVITYLPEGYDNLDDFLASAYPADIAEFLMNIDEETSEYILKEKMTVPALAEVIGYLDYETQKFLARQLPETELSEILSLMYADDATDFLGSMTVGKVKTILNLMKEHRASELQRLLGYDDESAGGLMTTEYLAFYSDHTAERVLEKLRMIGPDAEMIYYIYVISRKKELLGVLSVRQLLAAQPDIELKELMTENVISVEIDMDQEEVAHIFAKYDLLAVPVVNKNNQLMGIITVDDAIDVIEDEATEDIYKMAATADIHGGRLLESVKKRLPWLLILLVGDLLSGSVIRNFEHSLEAIVALAFFIPVLMDMGGNVGTQSLTVVVRGLATDELHFSNFWRHLWQEVRVGFMMAFILGLLISITAYFWQGNPILGLVVGASMFITLLTAVIAGTSIPFIMEALGADPAVAAGPFITTLIDISGLFIYFTMATILMEKLI
jgi:magnesium transporter